MSAVPQEHECDRILIVEGYSDLHFYAEFLKHLGRFEGVFIKEFKGKSNVLKRETLEGYLSPKRLAEKAAIGIQVDADDDPKGTEQSLQDHLRAITKREITEGTWHEGQPWLGFFVAPDTTTEGEVETLVRNAFPTEEPHQSMKRTVHGFHQTMSGLGWEAKSPDKGNIGAFLAAAHDDDPRLGPAARAGKFDFNWSGLARLRSFLETMPAQNSAGP